MDLSEHNLCGSSNDNLLDIISYLDTTSYIQLKQTCRRFRDLDISRLIQKTKTNYVIEYRFFGKLHRDNDLPARIWRDGTQYWYQYGLFHRDNDLPAIIDSNGTQYWYQYSKPHRIGRPAVIEADGTLEWYVNGYFIRKKDASTSEWGRA